MEWDAFLGTLSAEDSQRAERLAVQYGRDAARRRVLFHPVASVGDLEPALRRESQQVRGQVPGLYESIDPSHLPLGWQISINIHVRANGARGATANVIGPNGAEGYLEREYDAATSTVTLTKTFLWLPKHGSRYPRGFPAHPARWCWGGEHPLFSTSLVVSFRRWACLLERLGGAGGSFGNSAGALARLPVLDW